MAKLDRLNLLYQNYIKLRYPNLPQIAIAYPSYFKASNTTNGLTKCIVAYIRLNGWQCERISTSGRVIDNTKIVTNCLGGVKKIGSSRYIPSTSSVGSADISATIDGASIKIEVKNKKTKDRLSDNQVTYGALIDFSGGVYYIVKDFESFQEWFDSKYSVNPRINEFMSLIKLP